MLTYEAELNIFTSILKQYNLLITISPITTEAIMNMDLGIRRSIPQSRVPESVAASLQAMRKNTIYHVTDEFTCHYSLLLLPEFDEPTALIVGPYLREERDQDWLDRFIAQNGINNEWSPILEKHFRSLPCLPNDKVIAAALNSLGERIWGIQKFSSEEIISGIPDSIIPLSSPPDAQAQEDILSTISKIEAQYNSENQFMEAISQGRIHRVSIMLSNFSRAALENRTTPLRNIKNYSIILNTLMRKSVEKGGVHPLHIDRISSEFARKIETTAVWDDFMELWQEMAKKYCLLVKKHSNSDYSQLVQRIITRIDFDLTADLSLKAHAEALNVNASYLSSLFKKETGLTITDYVNRKRIEHAAYLLSTTDYSISETGRRCGIQDYNYFSKIFKKQLGVSPREYRAEHRRFKSK